MARRDFLAMLEIIKFVGAAACKKGVVPSMMHFLIEGGRITATNGNLTISAPFPIDIACAPHAVAFAKAVAACEGAITLSLESSRLVVRSGRFRSVVPCVDVEKWPRDEIAGEFLPIEGDLIPVFRKLLPFVATDELRPWACGIMLLNNSAFATNSVTLVEHWLPVAFPVVANIPVEAVRELVRLKIQPSSVQVEDHQMTFHLPENARVTCKMTSYQWPNVQQIFQAGESYQGEFVEGENLESTLEDVAKLHEFSDSGLVYFHAGRLSTEKTEGVGTEIENEHIPHQGAFRTQQITALKDVVHKVGFGAYPKPIPFYGEGMRGVMTGFRV